MSVSVVQTATRVPVTNGNTIVMEFATAPKPGNRVVAFCAYSQYLATREIDTPTGWTKIGDTTYNYDSLATFYRTVAVDETGSYTWTITGTAEGLAGVLVELKDSVTTEAGQYLAAQKTSSGTTYVTPEVTPATDGCLAFGVVATDAGGAYSDSVSSGWTILAKSQPAYHALIVATKDVPTEDTSTPITTTITSKSSVGVVATYLIVAGDTPPVVGRVYALPAFSRLD